MKKRTKRLLRKISSVILIAVSAITFAITFANAADAPGGRAGTIPKDKPLRLMTVGHSFFGGGKTGICEMLPAMLKHAGYSPELKGFIGNSYIIAYYFLKDQVDAANAWMDQKDFYSRGSDKIRESFKVNPPDFVIYIGFPYGGVPTWPHEGLSLADDAAWFRSLGPQTRVIAFESWGTGSSWEQYKAIQNNFLMCYRMVKQQEMDVTKLAAQGTVKIPAETDSSPAGKYYRILRSYYDSNKQFLDDKVAVGLVGEAWRTVYEESGGYHRVLLHRSRIDGHHGLWGGYLASCLMYTQITGEKFDGRGFSENYYVDINPSADPEEARIVVPEAWARYFEDVAWRTYAKNPELSGAPKGLKSEPAVPNPYGGSGVAFDKDAAVEYQQTNRFDKERRIVSSEVKMPDGSLLMSINNKYDAKGLLESESIGTSGKPDVIRNLCKRDDQGRLVAKMSYAPVGGTQFVAHKETDPSSTVEFTYAKGDKPSRELRKNRGGHVDERYEFSYSPEGRLVKKEYYTASDSLAQVTTYIYDDKGRLTTEKLVNEKGDSVNDKIYDYNPGNESNNPDTVKTVTGRNVATQLIFEYDKFGSVTKKTLELGSGAVSYSVSYKNIYP